MSEHIETCSLDANRITIDRGNILDSAKGGFKRYEITDTGVSPRSIPGTKGLSFVAASDEHDEYGNLISDVLVGMPEYAEMRKKMHDKRMRKLDTMIKDGAIKLPEIINQSADVFVITFGSTAESAGQLAKLIAMNTGIGIDTKILKYDGEAITSKEIADGVERFLKGV